MILSIYNYLTYILMQYGNIVQYDQIGGPYACHHFSPMLYEHKLFLYQKGV